MGVADARRRVTQGCPRLGRGNTGAKGFTAKAWCCGCWRRTRSCSRRRNSGWIPSAPRCCRGWWRSRTGCFLTTGPTGSGKTTTLYSILQRIYTPEQKIVTIEDPVEYELPGVAQIPVRPSRNFTFANGLRSILRQDPDVVMVGEIRDSETAEIAIRAALTGHQVFSTLHTNDSTGAVTRLLDMGVEAFLISSSLEGVLAQRLVRRICPQCRDEAPVSPAVREQVEVAGRRQDRRMFYRGAGCEECRGTGYRGRIGIFELLAIDTELREMILQKRSNASSRPPPSGR